MTEQSRDERIKKLGAELGDLYTKDITAGLTKEEREKLTKVNQ